MREAGKIRHVPDTLTMPHASLAHQRLARGERTIVGAADCHVRLSVGLRAVEDLDRALNGA